MKRGRAAALGASIAALGALAGAAYWNRDSLRFESKLRALVAWEHGAYVARSIRRELPDEVRALEDWFADNADFAAPRLRSGLRGSDETRRMTALQLLAVIAADRGERLDMDDFWQACEPPGAAAWVKGTAPDVLVDPALFGLHAAQDSSITLYRSGPGWTDRWYLEAKTDRDLSTTVRAVRLEGAEREAALLALGRAMLLEPFPGLNASAFDFLRVRMHALSAGRMPDREHGLTGWAWTDRLVEDLAELANRPPPEAGRLTDAREAAEVALILMQAGSPKAAVTAAWVLGTLDLAQAEREDIVRRVSALASGAPAGSAAFALALHLLGGGSEPIRGVIDAARRSQGADDGESEQARLVRDLERLDAAAAKRLFPFLGE